MENIKLHLGDCLEIMPSIPGGSVDMILCDLPYGTTACKWDSIIPLNLMWDEYNRIIKYNGVIALFATQPFTTKLASSQLDKLKVNLVWNKIKAGNFAQANKQPLKVHEDILIFYAKQPFYNPQKIKLDKPQTRHLGKKSINKIERKEAGGIGGIIKYSDNYEPDKKHPTTVITFKKDNYKNNCFHPTQKPIILLEYLIKTYTLEGQTILDNCMGSGSTGVACVNLNRKFIGIEKEEKYFEIASKRIEESKISKQGTLF